MGRILCIETATKVCSVCIAIDGKVAHVAEDLADNYSHAERLHVFIDRVVNQWGGYFGNLDAIAVSQGPGSYTGLRIGVSAAKGFAYSLGIPIIAVHTLQALALSVADQSSSSLYIPMIDARRMEVYCAGFDGKGEKVFDTRAEILDKSSFPEVGDFEKVFFFGDGAAKCETVFTALGFKFLKEIKTRSESMATLAEDKWHNSEFESTAYFEPFYLKDFFMGTRKKA